MDSYILTGIYENLQPPTSRSLNSNVQCMMMFADEVSDFGSIFAEFDMIEFNLVNKSVTHECKTISTI